MTDTSQYRRWLEESGTPIPEDAWATLMALLWEDEIPPELSKEKLQNRTLEVLIRRFVEEGKRTTAEAVEPPDSWKNHSARVLDHYRDRQAKMLAVFECEQAILPTRLAGLIEDCAGRQVRVGELEYLEYPVWDDDGKRKVKHTPVWAGSEDERLSDRSFVRLSPDQPLYRLWKEARGIEQCTGLSQSEAVGFLLADEKVTLPWIRIGLRATSGAEGIGNSVIIEVGSTRVRPNEVKKAYSEALRKPGVNMWGLWGKESFSRQTAHTVEMRKFVDERKRDERVPPGGWQRWCDEWNDSHPGGARYADGESLRVSWEQAERRGQRERPSTSSAGSGTTP